MIRASILDHQPVVRRGIRCEMERHADICFAGEADGPERATEWLQDQKPDVLICELDALGPKRIDGLLPLLQVDPFPRAVLFCSDYRDKDVKQALDVGIRAILCKSDDLSLVINAVRCVMRQECCYSPRITDRLRQPNGNGGLKSGAQSRISLLTERELTVLRYLALGETVQGTAQAMKLRPKTIENFKARIMDKLDIHNRVLLARYALREGLVTI